MAIITFLGLAVYSVSNSTFSCSGLVTEQAGPQAGTNLDAGDYGSRMKFNPFSCATVGVSKQAGRTMIALLLEICKSYAGPFHLFLQHGRFRA